MPALDDMLLAHAHADARTDLVAGNRSSQEIATAHSRPQLGNDEERRQRHRADMQDALAMDVVELETLDERAVDQGGVRGGEAPVAGPNGAAGRAVDRRQRIDQDAAPFEPGAEDRAAE